MSQLGEQYLYVDKYAPSCLDDVIMDDKTRKMFDGMIKNGNMPSMTFIASQGSGKTTMAKVLVKEFNASVLFVPCATDGTIDVLRTRIKTFCESCCLEDTIKIVILDEIDSASSSGDNNFQKGLRTLIEEFQDSTRFILTANYDKILPAVLSRCPIIKIGYDKKGLLKRVKFILDNEKVKYTKDSLKKFIETTFSFFPDIRRILNYLQACCSSGELVVIEENSHKDDSFISELVTKCKTDSDVLSLRKFYMSNKSKIDDYLAFSSNLFNYLMDNNLVNDNDVVLKISNIIYQMNLVIDKEIQFFSLITFLNKVLKNV